MGSAGSTGARATAPVAWVVQSESPVSPASGCERIRSGRPPSSSAAPSSTWSRTPARAAAGRASGAARSSVSTRAAPARSAACTASSRKAVPGSRTVPATVWSASHGWVRRESRPVNNQPSPSGSSVTPESSGWPVGARPPGPSAVCPAGVSS